MKLVSDGIAGVKEIDGICRRGGGFRMGPFELMDLIGLDVNLAVTRGVWEAYLNDPRYTPSVIQQELVAAGFHGRKTGRGFYRYDAGAEKPAPAQERPARKKAAGGRSRRSSVPSWDEIMFGTSRQPD